MKHLLPAFFFIAFTATLSAQSYKVDTVVNESWTNNSWQLSGRIIYAYNNACQLVSTTFQTRVGASWVNQIRINYTYTGGDNISQLITQQWNTATSSWVNVARITNTYNASFKVLTTVSDTWSGAAWQNISRVTNTYDANSYLLTTLNELSLGGVLWMNQTLDTYTNNPDGTVNHEVRQNWNGLSWDNFIKYTYTYNADKSMHQSIMQTWNGSAWVNSERHTYTYDAQGRPVTELTETWNGSAWENDTLTTNTFNGSGQLTNTLEQTWDAGSWKNQSQINFTYNGDGSLHQSVTQIANEALTTLINNSRSTFHYTTNCILPLTLLDFDASQSGKDILLKWTTTKEINTSYFEIQSSTDATTFKKIGSVNAAGNSSQKTSYEFTDPKPLHAALGKIFYQLKMVDKDGRFSYSKVAFVSFTTTSRGFSIFPTMVKDNLFLVNTANYRGPADIRIVDQAGRQVYVQRVNMQQAVNQSTINVSSLNKGVYYIQLITKEGSNTAKFLKN
ncbi:hypothetical protein BH10BAC3_BH10BAC3_17130 [soil metagenome]